MSNVNPFALPTDHEPTRRKPIRRNDLLSNIREMEKLAQKIIDFEQKKNANISDVQNIVDDCHDKLSMPKKDLVAIKGYLSINSEMDKFILPALSRLKGFAEECKDTLEK